MKELGFHLAHDLVIAAKKWGDLPRFYIPENNDYKAVSWNEYAEKVKLIAGFLVSEGLDIQDKVSVLGQNSFNWCITHLGIQSVRGVLVPIYPASQPDLLEYFLAHSDSKILFCDSSFLPIISKIDRSKIEKIVTLDDKEIDTDLPVITFSNALKIGQKYLTQVEKILDSALDSDITAIIYTSGTTGLPKGVMLTHANAQSSAADWISLNSENIPENAIDLHWLPLSHSFGSGSIMLGNRLGWQSYFVSHKELIGKLAELKPHLLLSVPAYWEKIYNMMQTSDSSDMKANFDKITGGRMTFGLSGGAGLKKEIKQGFHDIGFLVIEGYGLTECSPTLTMNRKDKFDFDSVGVPYPSVELKLADDGEILAKGPNIFAGYYKDETSTLGAFDQDGWFKTGDVGRWTEDGFLQIIDRKKEILVTSGGKNIPPQNIERMFQDNIYINHFVVYGDGKKYLTALITINEDDVRKKLNAQNLSADDLLKSVELHNLIEEQVANVNKNLPSYETIKKFWICPEQLKVEDNLLTSSLKIRRKAIYEKYREKLEGLY
ncbi:MAG: long-chain fatty acid--CoA ligase [Candidatus Sericytochromatia bacterium]|nr:long-chain fatty acid--CoA ligase [Candidatus Sericytochromatia bacterium]